MNPFGCPEEATGLSGRRSSPNHALLKAQTTIGQIRSPHNNFYDIYRRLKDQLEAQRAQAEGAAVAAKRPAAKGDAAAAPPPARKPGKLSFKEQREYDGMEAAILEAEERKSSLEAALGDPATYQRDGASVAGLKAELEGATAEVERLYARWQELEGIRGGTK